MKHLMIALLLVASFNTFAGTKQQNSQISLGATISPITSTTNTSKVKNGVVVTQVTPKSLAAKLGLQKDDLIYSVNGQDIINEGQLNSIFKSLGVGTHVEIGVARNGKLKTLWGKLSASTERSNIINVSKIKFDVSQLCENC